ncbi:MAG TPA: type II toxin-antitoxin system PemK/MazF family toxin [Planctomycetota bacterium]|nr:type II toxin-antitoxin system PemK/MazF family toxin [Planctomycetota bacterium]
MLEGYPQRGEVWLVPFTMPSADSAGLKFRPAVVVSAAPAEEARGTVTLAAISSRTEPRTRFDIFVGASSGLGRAMGLRLDSLICCAILQTFSIAVLRRRIGKVNEETQARISERLAEFFALQG